MNVETLPKIDGVEYKKVIGSDLYAVGTDGTIWSNYRGRWKQLKPKRTMFGYLSVRLYIPSGPRWVFVHRTVLDAFRGPCPDGFECRHFPNRDRTDNRLANLQWGSKSENAKDRMFHGTQSRRRFCAKISPSDVKQMRTMYATGKETVRSIAEQFGLAAGTTARVLRGKTWGDCEGPVVGADKLQPRKLTSEDIQKIISMDGTMRHVDIGAKFGVSQTHVSKIVRKAKQCTA